MCDTYVSCLQSCVKGKQRADKNLQAILSVSQTTVWRKKIEGLETKALMRLDAFCWRLSMHRLNIWDFFLHDSD